jgi:hypothetical protein
MADKKICIWLLHRLHLPENYEVEKKEMIRGDLKDYTLILRQHTHFYEVTVCGTKLYANTCFTPPFWTTYMGGGEAYYVSASGFVRWPYTAYTHCYEAIKAVVDIQRFLRLWGGNVRKKTLYKKKLIAKCPSTFRLLNEDVMTNIRKFLYAKSETKVDIYYNSREMELLRAPFARDHIKMLQLQW